MLVVGHTDTAGKPSFNDPLSLERAESLKDYLTDNVDGWLKWYATSVSDGKRWGAIEDRSMIAALPDAASREKTESPVRWFQRTRGLKVDGKAGPETRTALIKEYMALDGTSLPKGIELVAHGCGENFPRDATGDEVEDPDNRRTEVYFFDEVLGIQPPPAAKNSAKGSAQYPEWVRRSQRTDDFSGPEDDLLTIGRLLSVASADKSFAKPSTIPLLKEVSRRLTTNPVLQVVVLGNSEDTGDGGANKKLARARALTVRAWLLQDEDFFRKQFDSPEGGSKWNFEEVQWMLSAIEIDGDPCYAGYVDGYRGDATLSAIEAFQIKNELAPTRAMDETTLGLLIEQYLALLGDAVPDPDQVAFAVGGGGLVPRTSGKESKPIDAEEWRDPHFEGFRRTELFLWNQDLQPAPETLNQASGASHPSYVTWCKTAERELLTPQTLTAVVQVVDQFGKPVSASGSVFRTSDDGSEVPAASLSASARGIATLNLNPGVYTVVVGGEDGDATMAGLHVRIDEVGGVTIRLNEGTST
jgi:outer membrane protein OmpA-like peptidoglycan-associated protein